MGVPCIPDVLGWLWAFLLQTVRPVFDHNCSSHAASNSSALLWWKQTLLSMSVAKTGATLHRATHCLSYIIKKYYLYLCSKHFLCSKPADVVVRWEPSWPAPWRCWRRGCSHLASPCGLSSRSSWAPWVALALSGQGPLHLGSCRSYGKIFCFLLWGKQYCCVSCGLSPLRCLYSPAGTLRDKLFSPDSWCASLFIRTNM